MNKYLKNFVESVANGDLETAKIAHAAYIKEKSKSLFEARERKTEDEFTLQGDYGQGWGDLTSETTRKEIMQRRREYREEEPGVPFRIIVRRIKKAVKESLQESDESFDERTQRAIANLQSHISDATKSQKSYEKGSEKWNKLNKQIMRYKKLIGLWSKPVNESHNAFDVYKNNKLIDTVFDSENDADEVKRSLINHDGYDADIVVKKVRGAKKKKD